MRHAALLITALAIALSCVLSCGPTGTEDAGAGGGTGGGGRRDSGIGGGAGGGAQEDAGCTLDEQCRIDGGSDVCCFGDCFDLRSTALHCGMCFAACSANHTFPACSASTCTSTCAPGWTDCDNDLRGTGCEINTAASPLACGACNAACSTSNLSAVGCDAGQCTGTCRAGWADCNSDLRADGCERSVSGDVTNCGACNRTCSPANLSARGCDAGVCTGTCTAGFGDCNSDLAADGCETNTRTTLAHCGACNRACSTANLTPACDGGQCTGACNAGFADCNSNKQTDGCEVNIFTTPTSCGGCTTACSSNNITTRACTNGNCTGACDPGFYDCNMNKRTDGCETPSSNTNCHSCGDICGPAGRKTCVNAQCIGYTATTPAVAFIDACALAGMQRYLVTEFDATQTATLPFSFSFYGQPVFGYFISTNGLLGFGSSDNTSTFNCVPNAANPGAGIYAFADDLQTFASGVCAGTTGTAPNRKHVVTWSGVQRSAASGSQLTFSVILNETTNVIQVVYQSMTGDPTATGNQAVIGVQNAAGTLGTSFGCRAAVATSGAAVTFTP